MIIRTEKNKNYTTISNQALNDKDLSLKAKGLWAFLMSKPDGWEINISGTVVQLKEGRDAIRTAFDELEHTGYIVRGKNMRNEKGQYYNESAILYEIPVTVLENPTGENPTGENPTQVNTDKVNTDKVISTNVLTGSSLLKESQTKYGDSEINKIIDRFETDIGIKLNQKTKQRKFSKLLIDQFGIDNVLTGIGLYKEVRSERYAPQIDSIEDLYYKFSKLQGYIQRRVNSNVTKDIDSLV